MRTLWCSRYRRGSRVAVESGHVRARHLIFQPRRDQSVYPHSSSQRQLAEVQVWSARSRRRRA